MADGRVSFTLSPPAYRMLVVLQETGLFGPSVGAVARRIVEQSLAEKIKDGGVMAPRPGGPLRVQRGDNRDDT